MRWKSQITQFMLWARQRNKMEHTKNTTLKNTEINKNIKLVLNQKINTDSLKKAELKLAFHLKGVFLPSFEKMATKLNNTIDKISKMKLKKY